MGTVHAKDILAGVRSGTGETLQTILRPAVFVPGTREVEDVLADMRRQKIQLAIVLDEFGGTAGLVTMEDLLEEIVGQIYDEYDRAEPRPATPGTGDGAGAAGLDAHRRGEQRVRPRARRRGIHDPRRPAVRDAGPPPQGG